MQLAWARIVGPIAVAALALAVGCPSGGNGGKMDGGALGDGQTPSGQGGSGGQSGPVVWVGSHFTRSVRGIDTGSGETLAMIDLPADPNDLVIAAGKVWVGTDDGDLLAIDPQSGEAGDPLHIGGPIEHIAAGGGRLFVAHFGGGDSGLPPQVVEVDPAKVTELNRFAVVDINESHDGLILDGSTLYVLVGNGFALERVDPDSGAVMDSVALGENPDDPSGPRGDFYGYGQMILVGGTMWVLDEYKNKVLGVDATSLAVGPILDATSWLDNGGADYLASDGKDVFVSLKDANSIVRLDGKTGEVKDTYDYEDGAGVIAFKDGLLYMDGDESFGDLLLIDPSDGKLQRKVPGVYADNELVVQ